MGIQTFSNRGRKPLNRTYDKDYIVERLKEIKKIFWTCLHRYNL